MSFLRNLLIISLLTTFGFSAHAQFDNGKLSGFVGLNNSEYTGDGSWDRDFGVELGAGYLMPINGSLFLRTGLGLVQRNSETGSTSVKYLYAEIPLTLMFQVQPNIGIFGGFNFDVKMNSSPGSVSGEETIVVNLPLGARFTLEGPHSIEAILEFGVTDMADSAAGGKYKLGNSLAGRYVYTF
jgi:hypothetical protein